jgi:hypothetical protein
MKGKYQTKTEIHEILRACPQADFASALVVGHCTTRTIALFNKLQNNKRPKLSFCPISGSNKKTQS